MDAEVNPSMTVLPGHLETEIARGSYIIMSERNFNVVFNKLNLSIVLAVANGASRFSDLAKRTNIPKGQLARHLKELLRSGWLTKNGHEYRFTASIYVAAEVNEGDESIGLSIIQDKGAFLDPRHGLVLFRGSASDYCSKCPLRQACVNNVKELANAHGIKLHSIEPADAYMEVFRHLILLDVVKRFKSGEVNLKVATGSG